MVCTKCGNRMSNSDVYCSKCGVKVRVIMNENKDSSISTQSTVRKVSMKLPKEKIVVRTKEIESVKNRLAVNEKIKQAVKLAEAGAGLSDANFDTVFTICPFFLLIPSFWVAWYYESKMRSALQSGDLDEAEKYKNLVGIWTGVGGGVIVMIIFLCLAISA